MGAKSSTAKESGQTSNGSSGGRGFCCAEARGSANSGANMARRPPAAQQPTLIPGMEWDASLPLGSIPREWTSDMPVQEVNGDIQLKEEDFHRYKLAFAKKLSKGDAAAENDIIYFMGKSWEDAHTGLEVSKTFQFETKRTVKATREKDAFGQFQDVEQREETDSNEVILMQQRISDDLIMLEVKTKCQSLDGLGKPGLEQDKQQTPREAQPLQVLALSLQSTENKSGRNLLDVEVVPFEDANFEVKYVDPIQKKLASAYEQEFKEEDPLAATVIVQRGKVAVEAIDESDEEDMLEVLRKAQGNFAEAMTKEIKSNRKANKITGEDPETKLHHEQMSRLKQQLGQLTDPSGENTKPDAGRKSLFAGRRGQSGDLSMGKTDSDGMALTTKKSGLENPTKTKAASKWDLPRMNSTHTDNSEGAAGGDGIEEDLDPFDEMSIERRYKKEHIHDKVEEMTRLIREDGQPRPTETTHDQEIRERIDKQHAKDLEEGRCTAAKHHSMFERRMGAEVGDYQEIMKERLLKLGLKAASEDILGGARCLEPTEAVKASLMLFHKQSEGTGRYYPFELPETAWTWTADRNIAFDMKQKARAKQLTGRNNEDRKDNLYLMKFHESSATAKDAVYLGDARTRADAEVLANGFPKADCPYSTKEFKYLVWFHDQDGEQNEFDSKWRRRVYGILQSGVADMGDVSVESLTICRGVETAAQVSNDEQEEGDDLDQEKRRQLRSYTKDLESMLDPERFWFGTAEQEGFTVLPGKDIAGYQGVQSSEADKLIEPHPIERAYLHCRENRHGGFVVRNRQQGSGLGEVYFFKGQSLEKLKAAVTDPASGETSTLYLNVGAAKADV